MFEAGGWGGAGTVVVDPPSAGVPRSRAAGGGLDAAGRPVAPLAPDHGGGADDPGAAVVAGVAGLIAAASGLTGPAGEAGAWSGGQRAAVLAGLDRLAGVLVTVRGRVVAAERAAASTVLTGDRDFVAARARVLRSGLGVARREVDQAEAVTTLPIVASAVAAGRVPVAHLDVLARAASTAGQVAREALAAPSGQERLVRLAERLSVREFTGAVARLVATADPASLERGVAAQKAARFLHLTTGPDGVHLKGRVDVLAGATLRTALAGVGVAPDATRTKEQADADALIALAERATTAMAGIRGRRGADDVEQDAANARVSGVANRPIVSILVPAETFTHARALAAAAAGAQTPRPARPASEAGPGVEDPRPIDLSGRTASPAGAPAGPVEPAVLEDGTPIAMSQLTQALCDCQLGRIVLGADSVPLDLGRTTRLFTAAQRRAVIVRDRACAWNGCDVPAAYCEIHHITWWDRDTGPTDYDNAVLLCTHHHHVVHQHDLTLTRHAPVPWRDEGLPARDGTGQDTGGGARGDMGRGAGGGAGGVRRAPRGPLIPDEPVRYEFRERRGLALVNGPPR